MADNGFNNVGFKRNSNQDEQDGEDGLKLNEKAGDYMRELLSEKVKLNLPKFPVTAKLIDEEVAKVQASGRVQAKDSKYVDVFHERPVKVTVKVLVPVKEHPKFNFVGKLLGPKGNTLKHLQDETMCKMAILGRGSMRDKQKEGELRNALDPKYAHLTDELHVEISALAPPAEAHARIAYALAEIKKYLIPDATDMIRQNQMRDIMDRGPRPGGPIGRAPPPPRMAPVPPPPPPVMIRGGPGKSKVISILDKARSAMETQYPYDDPYGQPEPPRGGPRGGPPPEQEFFYDRGHERYFEDDQGYYKDETREYKANSRDVGTRRPGPAHARTYTNTRASPYARPK